MAKHPSPDELSTLKEEILTAARNGKVEEISDALRELSPQVIKQLLLPKSHDKKDLKTPLITAAGSRQTQVVELLLELQNRHCEEEEVPKCILNSAIALSQAALFGHLDAAEMLLREGAALGGRNSFGDTAPHRVLLETRLPVLDCLCSCGESYCGAEGETCLFGACRTGQKEVVRLLLDWGANPNHASASLTTPLHVAAKHNQCAVAEILLQRGATVLKDERGQSPLTVAAHRRSRECFDFLLTLSVFSRLEKSDALELLGGSYVPDMPQMTYHYLRRAMVERYRDPACILLKPQRPPVPELGNVAESQTLQELESKQQDHAMIQVEALLARERILGVDNIDTACKYFHVIVSRRRHGRYSEALAMWKYGRRLLRQQNLREKGSYQVLVNSIFHEMIEHGSPPPFSDFHHVLQLTVMEMESLVSADDKKKFMGNLQPLAYSCITYIWGSLQVSRTDEDGNQLRELTNRLMNISRSVCQTSVLHLATVLTTALLRKVHWREAGNDSFIALIDFLLQCGADVNQKDKNADSPLHSIVTSAAIIPEAACTIARILLEAGAHVDARNKNSQTPLEVPNAVPEVKAVLLEYQLLSLQCLAASTILQHNVPFQGAVPTKVENFIRLHSPHP